MSAAPIRHIFIACGEASGDRYGAALTASLLRRDPSLRISCLGGEAMSEAGAEVVADARELAVMGFSEVLSALPVLRRVRKMIFRYLAEEDVDLLVPIDFPGFNGNLAGRARKLGIPVFWLIAPQVWAWGGWRIGGLRRKIDRLGTILPFETDFFGSRGFDVFPMGHPLLEDYGGPFPFEEAVTRRERNLSSAGDPLTVAILPGSRRQELRHLLPILKVAGQALVGHLGERGLHIVVSAAPGTDPDRIREIFEPPAVVSTDPLTGILGQADLALVCSGTASLEAALAGVPHEVVYRTGAFNLWLARRLVRTRHIGLSNLILGRPMVREHIQDDVSPLPLAQSLLRWVSRPRERHDFYREARLLRQMCGEPGVWERTAAEILSFPTGDGHVPA